MIRNDSHSITPTSHTRSSSRSATPPSLTRRTLTVVGITVAVVLSLWLLWYVAEVVLLAFAAVLVAVFLSSLGSLLSEHTPLSYRWSIALVVIAIVGIAGLGSWLWFPRIVREASILIDAVPQTLAQLRRYIGQYDWGAELLEYVPSATTLMPTRETVFTRITGIFSSALSVLASTLIVLFAGLYLAIDPRLYRNGVVLLVPPTKRDHARHVLNELGYTLRWWLVGRLSSMLVIGVLTTIGLWLLGMPLALVLGVLAGLLEYIPNIGPTLAAIPALLIALTQGPTQVLYVLGLYLAVQAIESYLVTPLILKRAVSLPPALTILTLVLFGVLFGFLGLLLATPLAAVILVLVKQLYIKDTLGDDSIEFDAEPQQANAHMKDVA